jgi:hypothetical protein
MQPFSPQDAYYLPYGTASLGLAPVPPPPPPPAPLYAFCHVPGAPVNPQELQQLFSSKQSLWASEIIPGLLFLGSGRAAQNLVGCGSFIVFCFLLKRIFARENLSEERSSILSTSRMMCPTIRQILGLYISTCMSETLARTKKASALALLQLSRSCKKVGLFLFCF